MRDLSRADGSLVQFLTGVGYESDRSTPAVVRGPGVEFSLVPADTLRRGVIEVRMRMTSQPCTATTRRLGNSTLTLDGRGTATWRFGEVSELGPAGSIRADEGKSGLMKKSARS